MAVPLNADDPWSVDYPQRIALAKSILGHAGEYPDPRTAIDRALLALNGATIDEIRDVSH